jgi:hypothetical protein
VGDPVQDENEADFLDFDGDGDLDVFVANFSGTNRLYQSALAQGPGSTVGSALFHRTDTAAGGSLATWQELPESGNGGTTLDADTGDLDGDGDDDVVLANDANQQNRYFPNVLGIPDTHAPMFAKVTEVPDRPVGPDAVVHAQVRDNHAYYIIAFFDAQLVYSIDGGPQVQVSMASQGGQQFRGELPGDVPGTFSYRVEVTDLNGNTGTSATYGFVQGDGTWADLGSGLAGVAGIPSLLGSGTLEPGSPGSLTLGDAAPLSTALLFVALSSSPVPFKGGTLAAFPFSATLFFSTDGTGGIPLAWVNWPAGLPTGTTLVFQYAIADVAAVQGASLSNAVQGTTP